MQANEKRALIIGGGVAGPVPALFLKRSGFNAQVFEASSGPADSGGGHRPRRQRHERPRRGRRGRTGARRQRHS
jgi:2-polyprenyl-6-methoxyphenol hydroxylase-like FAD-dependent oxidoreductase